MSIIPVNRVSYEELEELINSLSVRKIQMISNIFKGLAHPLRLHIIKLLLKHEALTVTDLLEQMDVEQSLLSHHLAILRRIGVLESHKQGRNFFYRIREPRIIELLSCMAHCTCLND